MYIYIYIYIYSAYIYVVAILVACVLNIIFVTNTAKLPYYTTIHEM